MAKLFANLKAWQSVKNRQPRFLRKAKKSWRAKKMVLDISPTRALYITIRRFKTHKQKRAKTPRQIVLPVYFWPGKMREIVISYKRRRFNFLGVWRAASVWLILVGLFGGFYFSRQLLYANPTPPQVVPLKAPAIERKSASEEGLSPSEPVQVRIPAIGVDATIVTVGQNTDGTMQTPSLFDHNVGWYNLGPTPGEIGPAIFVGHVDNYKGPSVFWRLAELKPGDTIEISRKDGKTITFQIGSVEQFDQNAFPTEKVYGNIETAGLRLITCGGTFDDAAGKYTHNTVVLADMITTRASQ